jgi:hypothetical protein
VEDAAVPGDGHGEGVERPDGRCGGDLAQGIALAHQLAGPLAHGGQGGNARARVRLAAVGPQADYDAH